MPADGIRNGARRSRRCTGHDGDMKRIVLVLALAAIVAGACGGEEEPRDPVTYGDLTATTTPPAAPDGSTPPPAAGASTTAPPPAPDGGPRTPSGAPMTTRPAGGQSPASTAARPSGGGATDRARLGPPGSYARTVLHGPSSSEVAIEVIVEKGAGPFPATVSRVQDVVASVTQKRVVVTATEATAGAPSGNWSQQQILDFADRHATVEARSDRPVLRFLALSDQFAADSNAIGVAVRGDVFAIFTQHVRRSASPLVDAASIEKAVAVHEIGHLLGLVDIVLDRDRDDPEHPFHSRNRRSVMFWAIETDLVSQVLGGPPPDTFDSDDLADLAAIRQGG